MVGRLGARFADIRVSDRQTDRQTDTQDKYCNPPAHARRGLIIYMYVHENSNACTCTCTVKEDQEARQLQRQGTAHSLCYSR